MEDIVVVLVGDSGSGKTRLRKELIKKYPQFTKIVSSTTREPRSGEVEGDEYYYKTMDKFEEELEQGLVMEHTPDYSHSCYWTLKQQFDYKGTGIAILDTIGAKALKEKIKDKEVIVIYLAVDEVERLKRMFRREGYIMGAELIPIEVQERVSDRLTNDRQAFKTVQCDYVVDNNSSLEETVKEIEKVLDL